MYVISSCTIYLFLTHQKIFLIITKVHFQYCISELLFFSFTNEKHIKRTFFYCYILKLCFPRISLLLYIFLFDGAVKIVLSFQLSETLSNTSRSLLLITANSFENGEHPPPPKMAKEITKSAWDNRLYGRFLHHLN